VVEELEILLQTLKQEEITLEMVQMVQEVCAPSPLGNTGPNGGSGIVIIRYKYQ
jgi:hypothetical protein